MFFNYNFQHTKIKVNPSYVKTFNQNYFDLLEIMKHYSYHNPKFIFFYNNNKLIKRTKPSIFINAWHNHISLKYHDEIINENIEFFLSKSFNGLVPRTQYIEYSVNKALQFMIEIYPSLDENTLEIIKTKIKKLTILSNLYNNTKLMKY